MGLIKLAAYGGVVALIIYVMLGMGVNKVLHSHKPGPCHAIKGIDKLGAEDLVSLNSGHVLFTSGVNMPFRDAAKVRGQIFILDTNDPNTATSPVAKSLKLLKFPQAAQEFFPAGIAVWEEDQKKPLVYVINTGNFRDGVYVFELDVSQKTLTFQKRLTDPNFLVLNNLVLVGRDRFYATNFVRSPSLMVVEFALELPLGSVVYFDGQKGQTVLNFLPGPNGVAVSKDRKLLYVAMHFKEELHVYRIQGDNSLQFLNALNLHTGLDNVNVDYDDHIWIGAQPIKYRMLFHILDERRPAPSHVLKVTYDPKKNEFPSVQEIFADGDGSKISGITVAQRVGTHLLISSLMDRALICELRYH